MRYSNNLYHAQEFNNIKEIIYNSVEQYSKNIAFVIKHTENKKNQTSAQIQLAL